jgi:hypothetical protein
VNYKVESDLGPSAVTTLIEEPKITIHQVLIHKKGVIHKPDVRRLCEPKRIVEGTASNAGRVSRSNAGHRIFENVTMVLEDV